jgi:hypothetical protein
VTSYWNPHQVKQTCRAASCGTCRFQVACTLDNNAAPMRAREWAPLKGTAADIVLDTIDRWDLPCEWAHTRSERTHNAATTLHAELWGPRWVGALAEVEAQAIVYGHGPAQACNLLAFASRQGPEYWDALDVVSAENADVVQFVIDSMEAQA